MKALLFTKYFGEGPVSSGLITKYVDEASVSGGTHAVSGGKHAVNDREYAVSGGKALQAADYLPKREREIYIYICCRVKNWSKIWGFIS